MHGRSLEGHESAIKLVKTPETREVKKTVIAHQKELINIYYLI